MIQTYLNLRYESNIIDDLSNRGEGFATCYQLRSFKGE